MIRFGKISASDPETGRYRVEFEEDQLITAPLPYITKSTLNNIFEDPLDVGQPVAVIMDEFCEEGVILGAYNDKNNLPVFGNQDQSGVTYKDGTFIKYDRDAKKFTASFEGDVEIIKATNIKVAANLFEFNGGNNGELININQITVKLNTLVSQIQAQLVLISTGLSGVGGVYTPGTLTALNKNDYKDTKVTH